MIQRIQSIHLAFSAISLFIFSSLLYFSPIRIGVFAKSEAMLSAFALLIGIGLIYTIFLFPKRLLQLSILIKTIILTIIMQIGFIYFVGIADFYTKWHFYFLVSALAFQVLARIFIRKDEDLIKSVDRLR